MKTTIGGFVMSGKKGMKKYPIWIREKIFEEIKEGKSQNQISKEYGKMCIRDRPIPVPSMQ